MIIADGGRDGVPVDTAQPGVAGPALAVSVPAVAVGRPARPGQWDARLGSRNERSSRRRVAPGSALEWCA